MKSIVTSLSLRGYKIYLKFICIVLILMSAQFSSAQCNTTSDTPIITSDLCSSSAITSIRGTSTEAQGSLVEVFLQTSLLDALVSIGTTTVNSDGTWSLVGLNITTGLVSAKVTAVNELESLLSAAVEITPPAVISLGTVTDPTLCGATDGSIQIAGFIPFVTYDIYYTDESGLQTVSLSADALGIITISALGGGTYQELYSELNGCTSNIICSALLSEPEIPSISLGIPIQPIICGGTGSVVLSSSLLAIEDYEVSYYDGSGTVGPTTISSNILGVIEIAGLAAGTYSNIEITKDGCEVGLLMDRVTIYDGLLPSTVSLGLVTQPSCAGNDGSIVLQGLLPATAYDVSYEREDGSLVSVALSTAIAGTTLTLSSLPEGVYRNIRVTGPGGCVSTPLSDVNLYNLPTVALVTAISPLNCLVPDGSISINGLVPSQTYDVNYELDGVSQSAVSLTADVSGLITLSNLGGGVYTDLYVTQGTCQSNILSNIIELVEVVVPEIALGVASLPSLCASVDGSITLTGLSITNYLYDVSYTNSLGVQSASITSNSGSLTITGLGADEYSDISVSLNGCESNVLVCPVDLSVIPSVSLGLVTPETSCGAADGSITLTGLATSENHDISFMTSAGLQVINSVNSGLLGIITLTGLSPGIYSGLKVSLGGCESSPLADISVGSLLTISTNLINNPTACGANDGEIILAGTLPSTNYDVSYTTSSGEVVVNLTSNGAGLLTIPNLTAGSYTNIKVNGGSCDSNIILDPVSLIEVGTPTLVLGTVVNPSGCGVNDGSILLAGLTPSTLYDVFYTTTAGLQSVSLSADVLGVITINALGADDYEDIYVSLGGCDSEKLLSVVSLVDVGTPSLALGTITRPTVCGASDGSIELTGLAISTSYDVTFENSLGFVGPISISSSGSGSLIIPNLSADFYEQIKVSLGGCLSAGVGPVDLDCDIEAVYTVDNQMIDQLMDTDTLAYPTDADGAIVCAAITTGTLPPGVSIDADNGVIFVSAQGSLVVGSTTVEVRTIDVKGDSTIQDVTFEILNDTPVANDDTYVVDEGATLDVTDADGSGGDPTIYGVIVNDTDIANTGLIVTKLSDPAFHNGVFTLNADGTFQYVHDGSETTSDSFTYRLDDGLGETADASVTITINPQNDAPVAVADNYTFDEGSTNNVTVADGVLDNDSDGEGDAMTAILVTDVTNGTLTLNADGSFTYIHDGSETLSDSFEYKTNDGTEDGNTVMVTITITPVNDAPVAVADTYNFDEGSTNNVTVADGVLDNDTDAEGDALTAILVTDVMNGTLALNADGSFTYVHDGSETTSDNFTYKVNDGTEDGNTVTVTITINPVNEAPIAVSDAYTFDEGSTNNVDVVNGVLNNDTDPDGDVFTSILVTDVTNGTLTLNADGSFTYVHDGSETTTDSFEYKVNDGSVDGNTVAVTITITPINDTPVAVANTYTFDEGSTNTVDASSGVLSNDIDGEGDAMTAVLVSDVSNGTLTLNPDGSFTYIHDGSETTTDSFTYLANDGTGDGNIVTVTIMIDPVNDPPMANDDSYVMASGSSTDIIVGQGLLANDTDAEGDMLMAVLVSDVSNGTLTLNADGSFTYIHDGSATTSDSFSYKVNDGTSDGNTVIVLITIDADNDAPVAVDDSYTFDEGSSNSVLPANGVLANDTDPENNALTATLVSDVLNGILLLSADGSFTYDHDGSETMSDSFTYIVNDGELDGNVATVNLVINPQNDDPVAIEDSYTIIKGSSNSVPAAQGVLANDIDPDGDPLTAVLVTNASEGILTLNNDGSFTYVHNNGTAPTDGFSYRVSDGTVDGNTVAVSFTVTDSNTAPTANDDSYTAIVCEDLTGNVLDNDTDAEVGQLTVQLVSDVSSGSLSLMSDGSLTYIAESGFIGLVSFTYQVCDEGDLCSEGIANIDVVQGPDTDGDSLSDCEELDENGNPMDTDGDGIPNTQDPDDDGDGKPTLEELAESDPDCDGDGIPNYLDSFDACDNLPVTNTITPNGDGINDFLRIIGIEDYDTNEVLIYNRWGNIVFTVNEYENVVGQSSFIGNSNTLNAGQKLPDGTYFYVIKVSSNGVSKVQRGSLEIRN